MVIVFSNASVSASVTRILICITMSLIRSFTAAADHSGHQSALQGALGFFGASQFLQESRRFQPARFVQQPHSSYCPSRADSSGGFSLLFSSHQSHSHRSSFSPTGLSGSHSSPAQAAKSHCGALPETDRRTSCKRVFLHLSAPEPLHRGRRGRIQGAPAFSFIFSRFE
jgi:hypothetical protein